MSQIAAMPNKGTAEKATDCNWKKVFVRSKILEKKEKTGKTGKVVNLMNTRSNIGCDYNETGSRTKSIP